MTTAGSDATEGVVVQWNAGEGWGLIGSLSLDGLVWTHYSAVAMTGYRELDVGTAVTFTWERFRQDGHDYRALRVTPRGVAPADPDDRATTEGAAMDSELRVRGRSPGDATTQR